VPVMTAEIDTVLVMLGPSWFTVIVGVVPARFSTFPALPPLSIIQLAGEPVGSLSANFKLVLVRDVSRLTVISAVGLSVLKSAVSPIPSAMVAFSQFVGSPQMLLVRLVQTPSVAWDCAAVRRE